MIPVTTLRELHGKKVGLAIEQLHRAEHDLGRELLALADQQKVNHEVFHVARDIARWSQEHVRLLAGAGRGYGVDLDPDPGDGSSLVSLVRQKSAELTGRRHEPGLLLLAGLRHLHQTAAGVSLDWEVLAQTAQAMQDDDLLSLAQRCHPQTLRQLRWANALVKETSAQVMLAT
jgi:hypothetical protein